MTRADGTGARGHRSSGRAARVRDPGLRHLRPVDGGGARAGGFPLLELIPPRVFANTLSLAAEFQLGFNVEIPMNVAFADNGQPFSLGPSWNVYLRFRLDARKYFGGSSD